MDCLQQFGWELMDYDEIRHAAQWSNSGRGISAIGSCPIHTVILHFVRHFSYK